VKFTDTQFTSTESDLIMTTTICEVDHCKKIIAPSSWTKKQLADYHLDALKFCEFACGYCSSNSGLHILLRKHSLNEAVEEATGHSFDPHDSSDLVITYRNFVDALEKELDSHRRKPGAGQTLVYSQLTDGFSPVLLNSGIAQRTLKLLLEKTEYRIRILTKNAVVGNSKWLKFFAQHPDRFVVGLSIGTLDDRFAKRIEAKTSSPTARVKALRKLQDAGIPTYGMLCPVFPQVVETDELERLIESVRPELCEHVWAEPYNERHNWEYVRQCFDEGSSGWNWMTRVYENEDTATWSHYATDLYVRVHDTAIRDGWTDKLRYLLYEGDITPDDAKCFCGLDGVLLQCATDAEGRSKNAAFAAH
jgi:DNA repair photolyase